ncbi:MAG: hypothetical protein AAGI30_10065 [Planctomycetota bacterium]
MLPDALNEELSREPFQPVRLHLSDCQAVLITNPGLCYINRGSVYIARTDRPNSRIAQDMDLISLRHIIRVEQVDAGKGGDAASAA